jgi:Ser/Thr protein kinase RdoA (MazF antagonist)
MNTLDIAQSQLALWCGQWLRSRPAEVLFTAGHLSVVTGLRLDDGREVVVKVRPGSRRLLGCTFVHRHLFAAGFPCPRPLAGPAPLAGYAANAEMLLPGGEMIVGTDDAVRRHAALLADFVRLAPGVVETPTLSPSPPWVAWDHDLPGVWPPADDRPDDLNASGAASWLDDIGRRVRERLRQERDAKLVIGHCDFEAQNLRWQQGEPWAVHDWDSVIAAPEAVLVGHAAAVWPAGLTSPSGYITGATTAETEAFLDAYQEASGRVWGAEETWSAWAAGLWVLAFNAKKASLDGDTWALSHDDAVQRLHRSGL